MNIAREMEFKQKSFISFFPYITLSSEHFSIFKLSTNASRYPHYSIDRIKQTSLDMFLKLPFALLTNLAPNFTQNFKPNRSKTKKKKKSPYCSFKNSPETRVNTFSRTTSTSPSPFSKFPMETKTRPISIDRMENMKRQIRSSI